MSARLLLLVLLPLASASAITLEEALPYAHNNTKMMDLAHFEIKDVKKGTGAEAKPGVDVTVTIVQAKALGPNNTEDVIYQENLPLHFVVGTNKVPLGINVGMFGFKVGGHRILTVPPTMGEHMHHPRCMSPKCRGKHVPTNTTLVFDLTLDSAGPDSKTTTTTTTDAPSDRAPRNRDTAGSAAAHTTAASSTAAAPASSGGGGGGGGGGGAIAAVVVLALLGVGAYAVYSKYGKADESSEPKFERISDIELPETSS